MTEHKEGAGLHELSSAPRQRMSDYQTLAVNARMRILAVLSAAGVEPDAADELVGAVEAGAVAGAHCWVEELPGSAPRAEGAVYGKGWDGGISAATNSLIKTADYLYRQHGRARVASSLLAFGGILYRRLETAEPAHETDAAGTAVPSPAGVPATEQEQDEVSVEKPLTAATNAADAGVPDGVRALATPPAVGPTDEHDAIWLDDEGRVWSDYATVPVGDDVLPMVWAKDEPVSRRKVEEHGSFAAIAFCSTELLSTFGQPPADGAAPYATVWLDEEGGFVWADYPTADPNEDLVIPLVWDQEQTESRGDLERDGGFVFTRIGWSR
ncbi:hypothetical protein [Streptomyces chartreusis]|uniref:hypothetical protein n=1 Tax=Streptomyces chartreusis TaxID=1969 RepID=UPI003827831C